MQWNSYWRLYCAFTVESDCKRVPKIYQHLAKLRERFNVLAGEKEGKLKLRERNGRRGRKGEGDKGTGGRRK